MRLPGGLGGGVGARAGSGLMSGNAASPADEDGAARCAEGSSEEDVRHRRQKVEEDVRFFCDSRMWRGGTLTRPCEVFSQPLPTPPPLASSSSRVLFQPSKGTRPPPYPLPRPESSHTSDHLHEAAQRDTLHVGRGVILALNTLLHNASTSTFKPPIAMVSTNASNKLKEGITKTFRVDSE